MSNKNLFKSLWLLMLFLVVGTVSAQVTSQEAFVTACAKAVSGDVITLGSGEFNLNAIKVTGGKSLTFVGNGKENTTLKYGSAYKQGYSDGGGVACYSFDGSGFITIKNAKLEDYYPNDGNDYDHGFVRAGGMFFEDCEIASPAGCWGNNTITGTGVTFKNCLFTAVSTSMYSVVTYQANSYVFEGCTFAGNAKGAVKLYRTQDKSTNYNFVIKDCKFEKGSNTGKTPIYFYNDESNGGVYNIFIEGTNENVNNSYTVNSNSGSWIWGDYKGTSSKSAVYNAGVCVFENSAIKAITAEEIPSSVAQTVADVAVTKDETATEVESSAATTAVNTVVANTATVNATTEIASESVEGVSSTKNYLHIDVKAAEVAKAEETTYVKSMTFDIKPIAATITDGKLSTEVIPNSAIKSAITFRLPVDANATETTAEVFHNGESMGSNYQVQGTTEKYIEVSTTEFSEFGYQLLDAPTATYVAQIGTNQYESLLAALNEVNNQTGDDVVLEVLNNVNEDISSTNYKFTKNLTITASAPCTINFQQTAANGYLQPADGKTLTIGENITIDGLGNFGPDKTTGTAIVNGTVKAMYFRARGAAAGGVGKLIVNGTISAISGKGESYLRFGNEGYAEFNGNLTDATAEGLTPMDTKLYVNGGSNAKVVFNNIYVQMLKAEDSENTNLSFELNNSMVKFAKADYSNLNVTGTLKMDNKSTFDVGQGAAKVTIAAGATAELVPGAKIIANGLQNNGTIKIDLTGASGKTLLIDYNGNKTLAAANYGHIVNENNEDFTTYVENNDLYANLASKIAAFIDLNGYETLAAAIAAVPTDGTATTIKVNKDIDLAAALTVANTQNITLDLNGKTVKNEASKSLSQLITVNGKLTIDDSSADKAGKIQNTANNKYVLAVSAADAVLTLANGTVQSTIGTTSKSINASKGTFVMTGGKIISTGYGVSATTVNISGGEISAYDMAVSSGGTISGGTLTSTTKYAVYTGSSSNKQMVVSGGTFNPAAGKAAVVIYCANAKVTGGIFNVSNAKVLDFSVNTNTTGVILPGSLYAEDATDAEIYVNGELYGYYSIAATNKMTAPAAETTYKLTKDVNVNTSLTNKFISVPAKVVAINLNGKNITSTGTTALDVAARTSAPVLPLTIDGEGTVSANNGGGCNTVNVNQGVNLTIKGGTYKVGGEDDNTTIYIMKAFEKYPSTVNIEGGNFYATTNGWALNIQDAYREYAKFNVTGGTFHGFNPADNAAEGEHTNFVAKAFEAVDNADGTWTVKLAPVYIDVHENVSVSYTGTPNDDETSAANEVVSALASNTAVTETGSTNVTDITAVTNLAITVKEVAVETTPAVDETPATATVTKVTYDVQPMNGEDMVTETERPITFRLPVPQSFKGTYVKVSHLHEGVTTSTIESVQVANANKYVTLSSNKFSEWTLEDVNPSTVAVIGETQYNSLADAVAAATEGQTITMLADADVTAQVEVAGKNITLDLNGKKIEYTGTTTLNSGVILVHNGAGLTINGEAEGSAIVSGEKAYAAVAVTKKNDDATQPAVLTVNSGTLTGYYYAVVGNGTRHNTEITINGGNLTGQEGTAIYHPQDGTLNIAGGNLTGKETAVELRAGTINVTGGTLTANATEFKEQGNGSGTTIVGAALAVSQHTTNKDIAVNISGGEFNGIKAVYEKDYQDTNCDNIAMDITGGTFNGSVASQNVEKFVSGGTFTVAPALEYCEEGYAPGFQNDGTFTVKEYAVAVLDQNGNVKGAYKKITAPTNAELGQPHTDLSLFNDDKKTIKVVENDVIVLLKDISANVQWGTISNNVKFSIDLNGHTWTGTSSLYYDGSTINVKNGKIAGGVQVKSMTFNVEESTEITGDIKLDSQAQSTNINVAGKIAGITDEGTKSNSSRTITFAETANVNGQLALNKEQQDTRKITYNVNITCGTFNTNGHTILLSEKNINNVTISGGTFVTGGNGPLNIAAKVITGGTFDTDVNANCVAGYEAVDNGNGTWTVKYVGARVLKVYKTDGTYEELSKSLFEEYQETNPNAMAIVSSENADEVEGMTNVIVDYPVGKNGHHYYECEKFVLTDKENWYSPVDFTANSGSYTRTNVGGLNSVCMPFELNSSNIPANSSIKLFSYTNDTQTDVFFRTYPQASAGQACILDCPSDIETWVVEFDETEISASTISSALVGAYQKRTIGEGYYKVNADGDKFTKTTSSSTVTPFRCYLDLSQDGVLPANAPALRIVFEEDGVEGITDVETVTEDNAKIYGVDGILRGTIRPGLNIIQSNGVSKKIYK